MVSGTLYFRRLLPFAPQGQLEVVKVLARIGDLHANDLLLSALTDADERVVEAAAAALAAVGDARAVAPLTDYCSRYSPEGGYRNDPNAPSYERSRGAERVSHLASLVARVAGDIAPEGLQKLVDLKGREFHMRIEYDTPGYGGGADDFSVTLDFSPVRSLAAKERRRRGLAT